MSPTIVGCCIAPPWSSSPAHRNWSCHFRRARAGVERRHVIAVAGPDGDERVLGVGEIKNALKLRKIGRAFPDSLARFRIEGDQVRVLERFLAQAARRPIERGRIATFDEINSPIGDRQRRVDDRSAAILPPRFAGRGVAANSVVLVTLSLSQPAPSYHSPCPAT